ncbi:hypothetical protein LWI28_005088 [Acer negundo]|uniref:N-acetyltransferase domain-containing protein n=1 Tax=Acer negundo TaxID=4023 RepID=A0AAD5JCD4_ACENE|nr:hypothetical protein LWI28_005088 [Acer negundo]KAK4855075.1 hypothetical protein QYF36_003774 [Acer negundo]
MGYEELIIRSYDVQTDRIRVEDLEKRCEVGPTERVFLFTDTLGDPICRIRNSPMYKMLVAELGNNELVGVIQGSIKRVTIHKPTEELAKVGYVLGLRVVPLHRRKGIGLRLVKKLEEWFISKDVDYAYMATEKDNEASVKLFLGKLGFIKFRTPSILVHPVNNNRVFRTPKNMEIARLNVEEAEKLYKKFMASTTEFFPYDDIGNILRNKLSLGTWVAYPRGHDLQGVFGSNLEVLPKSWAMLSVWNSGELFKLRLEKAPLSCLIYTESSKLIEKYFPCFKLPSIPDFYNPFGFYFMYGVHKQGPLSGKMVRTLCKYVHNMATNNKDCKVIVTEVGGNDDSLRVHIPHWKLLSCPEDLWCIKALKNEKKKTLHELTKIPPTIALFVDPREV